MDCNEILAFSSQEEYLISPLKNILYCEADGNYTTIYFLNGYTFTIAKQINVVEHFLGKVFFIRIHNKTLVNKEEIRKIYKKDRQILLSDGTRITFAVRRKKSLLAQFKIL